MPKERKIQTNQNQGKDNAAKNKASRNTYWTYNLMRSPCAHSHNAMQCKNRETSFLFITKSFKNVAAHVVNYTMIGHDQTSLTPKLANIKIQFSIQTKNSQTLSLASEYSDQTLHRTIEGEKISYTNQTLATWDYTDPYQFRKKRWEG